MKSKNLAATIGFAIVALSASSYGTPSAAGSDSSVETRLAQLESREQIRVLFNDYGRTLDARDFAAFGRLFAKDAEYVSGPGEPAKGPAAIQAMLTNIMGKNPSHLPEPNFHLFFNESIQVDGDHAHARSKGGFVVPDPQNNRIDMVFLATYEDDLVREDGTWKFQRRVVHSDLPAPPRAK